MKQSKKLLSLVLAIVMMFGVFSVGASALTPTAATQVKYNSIDEAELTAEQVAGIINDILDEVLAGVNLNISALGLVIKDVDSTLNTIAGISTLADIAGQDVAKLKVDACKGVKRSGGDLKVLKALLQFLADNVGGGANLQKVLIGGIGEKSTDKQLGVGGILWNGKAVGISLGFSLKEIVDGNEIIKGTGYTLNGLLKDIPGFLKYELFEMLLKGSFAYTKDKVVDGVTYPNGDNKTYQESGTSSLSLDAFANTAVYNLLTTPQSYKYEGEGEGAHKVWDANSIVSKSFAALDPETAKALVNVNTNSLLGILDNVINIAYDEFGPTVLNNDAKKLLMQATGVDFIKLDNEKDASLIATIKAAPDYVDVATASDVSSVKNYLCNAQMWKVGGVWYFRDNVNVVQRGADGNALLDADGNEIVAKEDRFFKANVSGANEFYDIVNWDYKFVPGDIDLKAMITENGSLFGSLNSLLYKVLVKAVNSDVLDVNTVWTDGANSNLNANLLRTAKYVLKNYTRRIFGKNSEFVDPANGYKATAAFAQKVDSSSLIELVEYIGLPFFSDAMPQLILPEDGLGSDNEAKLVKFGVSVIREFLTDITPDVNYDSYIYTDLGTGSRKYANHTADEWINVILNMGMDVAFEELRNITNFTAETPAQGITLERWQGMLDTIILWAADYVGTGSSSVLNGFDPNKIASIEGPFNKLSYILNTLLPLGFISGCETESYAFDVQAFYDRVLMPLVKEFDIEAVLSLFGRSNTHYNFLKDTNVVKAVLDLLNSVLSLVTGNTLFANTSSLNAAITGPNLATLLTNLLKGINNRKDGLLDNALPVVAIFISDWGGEQAISTPKASVSDTYVGSNNGSVSGKFKISGSTKGMWRSYVDASGTRQYDKQYSYEIIRATFADLEGNALSNWSVSNLACKLGETSGAVKEQEVTLNGTGIPVGGQIVTIKIFYKVLDEDGNQLGGQEFAIEKTFFAAYGAESTNESTVFRSERKKYASTSWQEIHAFSPYFVNISGDVAGTLGSLTAYYAKGAKHLSTPARLQVVIKAGETYGISIPVTDLERSEQTVDNDDSYRTYYSVSDATALSNTASGSVATWTISGKTSYTTKTNSPLNVKMYLYNGAERDSLKRDVQDELKMARKAYEYDSAAWEAYMGALKAAFASAYTSDNAMRSTVNMDYNGLKAALANAVTALEAAKLVNPTIPEDGAVDNTAAIADLKATVKAYEGARTKGYTDYLLYRWDRYVKWRNKANDYVNRASAVSAGSAETQKFPYANLKASEVKKLSALTSYEAYINALLVNMTEEEAAAALAEYNNGVKSLNSVSGLDIAQAKNMYNRSTARLIERYNGEKQTYYLQKEIADATAAITSKGNYTDKSWARYTAALQAAQAALNANESQVQMFDAKYELQVARNELRTEEADDTELKALIAQAQAALAGAAAYDNTNAEFGAVLAALGMAKVTDADGNEVDLFPNGALNIVNKSYDVDDQRKYDRAADALRAALAKLTFKGATVAGASETKVGEDEDGNAVTVKAAVIDQKLAADAVKGLFTLAAADDKVVSLNGTYALSGDDTAIYTGTGSTLTFVKTVNGVALPVYTLNLVVKGDINGDGVVDALDAMAVELAANNGAALNGLFFAAGDVTNDGAIAVADYSAVVNTAVRG